MSKDFENVRCVLLDGERSLWLDPEDADAIAAQVAPLLDQARAEGAGLVAERAKSCPRHPHWSGVVWDCAFCDRAVAERDRLRAAVEALADEWERLRAEDVLTYASRYIADLRALLADAQPEPADQPEGGECPCGCPSEMHVGEIGCPCGMPDEPPCSPDEHTRSQTDAGPDYCAECSDAAQEWVEWPCNRDRLVTAVRANESLHRGYESADQPAPAEAPDEREALTATRKALRTEIGPPTDRDNKWQPMVSAGEVRRLLDALDEADRRSPDDLLAEAWDEGYRKGNLDGYFGTSDEWEKNPHGTEHRAADPTPATGGFVPPVRRCQETRAHYAHRWTLGGLYADCPGGPDEALPTPATGADQGCRVVWVDQTIPRQRCETHGIEWEGSGGCTGADQGGALTDDECLRIVQASLSRDRVLGGPDGHDGSPPDVLLTTVASIVAARLADEREAALLDAAEELDAQPPKLKAQYVEALRLYAAEPGRMQVRADRIAREGGQR